MLVDMDDQELTEDIGLQNSSRFVSDEITELLRELSIMPPSNLHNPGHSENMSTASNGKSAWQPGTQSDLLLTGDAFERILTERDGELGSKLQPVPVDELAAQDIKEVPTFSDEEEDLPVKAPPQSAAKRAAQRTLFREWIKKDIEILSTPQTKNETKDAEEEILSIRSLLAKQDSVAITDPREYQLELYERAKKENTIAVLDTGSGKTLIAVLLLRHILDQEVEDRATGKAPKIAFFIVNATTLVFQQFAVLESNLDHKIERFCGAMGVSLWTKGVWEKHIKANMVIVCTAEVLYQCLFHSFIKMEQINLLIFDEAHHAKQNHPYAKIVREFYMEVEDQSQRPRIFGMTASPVDAKVDVVQASQQLEGLLNCRIATAPLSEQYRNQATEYVQYYTKLPKPYETVFHQELKARFGNIEALERVFNASKALSAPIGSWGSDFYWSFALADEQARKAESRVERQHSKTSNAVEKLDADMRLLREAAEYVAAHSFTTPQINETELSSKVFKLHRLLQQHFERPTDSRCIVFVEQRSAARLLHHIFARIGGPNLTPGILTGAGSGKQGDASVTFREQVITLLSFRKGTINCLFATSVAEEGLDIPDCNLVIRFDLYKSMIGYVQSKGRARHKHSKFIDMVEKDNRHGIQAILDARKATKLMFNWCYTLPEGRLLHGYDHDYSPQHDVQGTTSFREPSTGAKITYDSSLSVLAHFCAMLPVYDNIIPQQPQYIISPEGGRYICEVIMPSSSPFERGKGLHSARKATAKRSAAYEMCKLLRENNYLDANLLPIYAKSLPAMRNAQLALSSKKGGLYPMQLKPTLWEKDRGTLPAKVYLTIIDVEGSLDRPHKPLGILTRHPLPDFPKFPLFLNDGSIPLAVVKSLDDSMTIDAQVVGNATDFTLLLFRDVFNKTYERNPAMMSYWIVPLLENGGNESEDPRMRVDWETLKLVAGREEYEWSPEMPHEFLKDRFLIDRWNGGRRWFTIGVDPTKKPLDPVPDDAVRSRWMENILEYSISLFKKSRAGVAWKWKTDQPVIEVDQMQFRRNILAKPEKKEKKLRTKAWVVPQMLKISTIPSCVAIMVLIFPAIIHRLEDYMIALEASDLIGLRLNAALALEAVTKDSDNSEEHQEQRINFRAGMGANYERLEFIGDCFLKMATSISLFGRKPGHNEFEFHVSRMLLLCNKNLFVHAKEMELYNYVRSMAFSRRTWYPQGIQLLQGKGAGKNPNEQSFHSLGDKTVADVSEALIGAAFVQYNRLDGWKPEDWDAAVKTVTVMVKDEDHIMLKWEDYLKAYEMPEYQTAQVNAAQRDLAQKVALEHPYHFKWPRLLRSAFTHPSNPSTWDKIPSYERLEFLGDSLLDTACVTHLFYRYPSKDPQWLTEHKMAMVSNKFLGALCVKIGFYKHMRHCHSQLDGQIREYITEVEEAESEAKGACDYWTGVKSPPKCLPDIVEAYVGAIFIDSDFDYNVVQRFFDMHIKPFFEDMTIYDTFANNHPTTFLHTLLATQLGCRDYRLLAEEVPQGDPGAPVKMVAALIVHEKVVGHATGQSGRYAKVKASMNALELLKGLAPFEFREQYQCDCRDVESENENQENGEGEVGIEKMGTAI